MTEVTHKDFQEAIKTIAIYYRKATQRKECVDFYVKFIEPIKKEFYLQEGNQSKSDASNYAIPVVNNWVSCDERLPEHLQTVWLANKEKQWVCLGCLVDTNDGWNWAESNGVIYIDERKIVSECKSDDLDVTHWCALPEPPCC